MPRKDDKQPLSAQAQQDLVSDGIENFELPKTLVTRLAKSAIPENSKLQREAILSLIKGSTVFINYLAATAHDVASSKQHKSITAADVLKALELLEFGDLVEKFQEELNVYRELAKTDKTKKGNASTTTVLPRSGPRNGPLGPSVTKPAATTTSAKGKGKAAASSASGPAGAKGAESASSAGAGMDVDAPPEEEADPEQLAQEGEEEQEQEEEEEEEQEEQEPLEDKMAIEEEELRKDAKGLEGRGEDDRMQV